jgi:hypothetical protein
MLGAPRPFGELAHVQFASFPRNCSPKVSAEKTLERKRKNWEERGHDAAL